MANIKLSSILPNSIFTKIAIDDNVPIDANGNYVINVGYLRVSTDKQAEEGFGLDIQENEITRMARNNNLPNLVLYIDDGYTGTTMDRPALNMVKKLITDFNVGIINIKIDTFIVARIDRLARTMLGTLEFIRDYIVDKNSAKNSKINKNPEDINFLSVAQSACRIEKNNPQGKFLTMFFASLAEYDRDLIVEKLQKGKHVRASSGKWTGGNIPPYGYLYDSSLGILVPNPETCHNVELIYRAYVEEDLSPTQIMIRFGLKTEAHIRNILKNRVYIGYLTYKGEEFKGLHQSLISEELWEQAQERIKTRSVIRGKNYYLFTGLMYCGECGAKLRYNGGTKDNRMIYCYSREKSKPKLVRDPNCPLKSIWQLDLEQAVLSKIFEMSYNFDANITFSPTTVDTVSVLNEELKRAEQKLSKLYDFETDEFDDILKNKIQSQRKTIAAIKQSIVEENAKRSTTNKVNRTKEILLNLKDNWNNFSQEHKQTVCRELIEKIVVYNDGHIDLKLKLQKYFESPKQ